MFASPPKILTLIVLLAFSLTFAIVPAPAQAGGGGIFGSLLGMFVGFLIAPYLAPLWAYLGITTGVAFAIGITASIASNVVSAETCGGSYDAFFGTCTRETKRGQQQVSTNRNVKFLSIVIDSPPTAEEFVNNPATDGKVNVKWQADAQPGVVNYIVLRDEETNKIFTPLTGPTGNVCSAGPQTNEYLLPFGGSYKAEIWLASCWQIRSRRRGAVPTCSGCGYDFIGTNTTFDTPPLPAVGVDIKADGQDGPIPVIRPARPVELSWETRFAASCVAKDSWSGTKPLSGREIVTPIRNDETYTISCSKSTARSITPQAQEFGTQPFTTTVFDFSSSPAEVSLDSFKVSYDWCWEDGGSTGCFSGSRDVAVGQNGIIFSTLKDDGGSGVPGPNCLGYSGNPNAYDYCMSIHSSKWENKKLTVSWEGLTDRNINSNLGHPWLTKFSVEPRGSQIETAEDFVSFSAERTSSKFEPAPTVITTGGPQILKFEATEPLSPGSAVRISWDVGGATYCEVDQGIGRIPCSGSAIIIFFETTTFTLTAQDDQGRSVSAQKTVTVRRKTPPGYKEIPPK